MTSTSAAVASAISQVKGVVGVSAEHLDTAREVRHNADEVFFTASTLKVPLLVELYRQVDQGKVDMNRRIELNDQMRVGGTGVFKEFDAVLMPSLHDLAMMMIIVSDNLATDLIFDIVGKENLNRFLQDLGMSKTRIPMNAREILYNAVGLDINNPAHTYEMVYDRVIWGKWDTDADAFSEERSDVSSPNDMTRLLEILLKGDVLTPSSRDAVLDIMKRQQLTTMIPLYLPPQTEIAHKTGYYNDVRCDIGIVFSPKGPYTIALMGKKLEGDGLDMDIGLARISKAIYDEFVG